MYRPVPVAPSAERADFPTEDVRNGVCGGGSYGLAFSSSDRQLIEVNFLNFDPIFTKSDELQERRMVFLLVGVGPTDPGLNVLRSGCPRQGPEGWGGG